MTTHTPRVLFLSVAVEPPWTRSDKNLVRLVSSHLTRYVGRVLTHEGNASHAPHVEVRPAWGKRSDEPPSLLQSVALFNRVIADTDAELVHLFWPADLVVASMVRGACAMRELPIIHTLVRAPRTTVAIRRTTAGDPVVCLSRQTLERVQREGTVNPVYMPPGVSLGLPGEASQRAILAKRHGFPDGRPICIYAGDYRHSNAARTVAATVPRVLREIDCHFVMACRVRNQQDRDEEARIKAAIAADGLEHHVSFVGEVRDLRGLLAIADIQLFPADSHHEKMDMPMVLLEGMAASVATVVANKRPLDELVRAEAALGVPAMQPVALAVAVVELLRDPQRRQHLGAAGRRLIEERFSIEQVAARYEALYDEALRNKERPAA